MLSRIQRALPATGEEIGGLLLGARAGAKIRLLDSLEIPCSHALGPAFLLTPQETARGREMVQSVSAMQVIGWYCCRANGEIALSEAALALFRDLFPAQWQITLVLRAGSAGSARAAFFYTPPSGEMRKGAERDLAEALETPQAFAFRPAEVGKAPRLRGVFSWVLTAIIALAVGAAAFEIQNTWFSATPPSASPPAPAEPALPPELPASH